MAAPLQDDLLSLWQRPTAAFRGKPFWSWNGRLEKDELLRQIHVFAEMGMGGFFMHSRTGLVTEYLGDEWFELINACSDEAKKLGLEAWLYDEDRWPSGSAGGIATRESSYRMKLLRCRVCPPDTEIPWHAEGFVAVFAAAVDGLNVSRARRFTEPGAAPRLRKGESLLLFATETTPEDSFYNGHTYLDTLRRDATEHFLHTTHERYRERCGDRLGGDIRGIFTDEPHHGMVMCQHNDQQHSRDSKWTTPWTPSLFGRFQDTWGYDLRDHLPGLFLRRSGKRISPVKWQYMELLQQMFLDQWAQPLHAWCREHKLVLTGHVLHEDSLAAQAVPCGSMMRYYEHMDYPGVDVLASNNQNFWLVKQLTSSARQLGKKWLLSELYGCTGWQTDFTAHKRIGDWQALFGINIRCHHLSWYTMAGEAKRDYPASISFQSAWHSEYAAVEDYFSRLGVLLQAGEAVCDVLVVNPVESTWAQIHAGWARWLGSNSPDVDRLEKQYAELFRWLTGAQIDFDYGDEEQLARLAAVDVCGDGPVLAVGHGKYRVAIVAGLETVRASTLALLRRFAEAGGRVIFAGPPPAYVDARPSAEAAQLAEGRRLKWREQTVVNAVRAASHAARVVRCDAPGVLCQVRRDGASWIVIALNPEENTSFSDVRFCLSDLVPDAARFHVEEWDCLRGERVRLATAPAAGGGLEWTGDFPPLAERAFVLTCHEDGALPVKGSFAVRETHLIQGPFEYELSEPNLCVLDFADWRFADGDWEPAAEILQIDESVRRHVGLEARGGTMVQPWARPASVEKCGFGTVRLRFSVDVAVLPTEPVELLIEAPEDYLIEVNGVRVAETDGWFIDPCLRRVPIPVGALREGENQIELEATVSAGLNLEAIYLAGRFGVTLTGRRATLDRLPERLNVGDLTTQGLPFYSGKISWRLPVPAAAGEQASRLTLHPVGCAALKLRGAHGAERLLPWAPFETDLRHLPAAEGHVTCEMYLTRRNTFGPLHEFPREQPACGPTNFRTTGTRFTEEYQLFPCGFTAAPSVSYGTDA